MTDQRIHSKFKAPEGKYCLHGERTYGSLPFNYIRATRIALARLRLGCDCDDDWLIYNSGDYVYICKHDSIKRVGSPPASAHMDMLSVQEVAGVGNRLHNPATFKKLRTITCTIPVPCMNVHARACYRAMRVHACICMHTNAHEDTRTSVNLARSLR